MRWYDVVPRLAREDLLMNSGALGLAVVAVIQFVQLESLDWALKISLLCFAASVPILSMNVFLRTMELDRDRMPRKSGFLKWVSLSGLPIAFIGISAIFFHFSAVIGLVFLAVSCTALVAAATYSRGATRT